jgi:uncharacterized damage-inducible protein DinB
MAPHLLVAQLRFARSEWQRGLEGVGEAEAVQRVGQLNCLSWMVGHLANQESGYWVLLAQGKTLVPGLNNLVGHGKPASTPPLAEMWEAWRTITQAADAYLETLTPALLQTHFVWDGQPRQESVGTMLMRNIYHYWYHIGEAAAVRQALGHANLPQFVGDMSQVAYRPE